MTHQVYAFEPPERFVAGTVGEPGDRVFYLQARGGGRVVSVALEKVQVSLLAEKLDELLGEAHRRFGLVLPEPDAVWLACSHGDVIKAIVADALGLHLDLFQRIMIDPASFTVIRYTPVRPFVLRQNDTGGDLAGLRPPPRRRRASRRAAVSSDAVPGGGAGAG